jgi:hypothetical protein
MDTTEAAGVEARRDYKKETRQSRSTGQTELNEPEETKKAEADPSKPEDAGENCLRAIRGDRTNHRSRTYSGARREARREGRGAEAKPSEPTNEAKDGTEPAKES